jgi:hypothetical protein
VIDKKIVLIGLAQASFEVCVPYTKQYTSLLLVDHTIDDKC